MSFADLSSNPSLSRCLGQPALGIAQLLMTSVAVVASVFPFLPTAHAQAPAQQVPSPVQASLPPARQTKDDLKGAQKAADRADKAAAEGKAEEALRLYDDAIRMAPGDIGIRRRAAGVRAQVIQTIVDDAE